MTPVGKFTFILGKLIPYWIIALVVMSVCLVIAWLLYGITSAENLGLVYMLAMLLALFFSGFGILVSNCNDTMQQAVFVMWFTVVCLMLLSGLFTPVRSMPQWAYATHLCQPYALFHRCHTHGVCARRRFSQHCPPSRNSGRGCHCHQFAGHSQLLQKQLTQCKHTQKANRTSVGFPVCLDLLLSVA